MPFRKGDPKPPGSGRKAGQPSKTQVRRPAPAIIISNGISGQRSALAKDVASRLEELRCDPIEGLARLALDAKIDPAIRRLCFSDLMKYVYPQRRSVEFSGQINTVGVTIDGTSALRALEDRILGIRQRLAAAQPVVGSE